MARPVRCWQVTPGGTVQLVDVPAGHVVVRVAGKRAARRRRLLVSTLLGLVAAGSAVMAVAGGWAAEPGPGAGSAAAIGKVPVVPGPPAGTGPGGPVGPPVAGIVDGTVPDALPWIAVPDPGAVGLEVPVPTTGPVPVAVPDAPAPSGPDPAGAPVAGPDPVAPSGPAPVAPPDAGPAPSSGSDPVARPDAAPDPAPSPGSDPVEPSDPVPSTGSAPVSGADPVPTPGSVPPTPSPTAQAPTSVPVAAALLSAPLAPLSPVTVGTDGRPAVPPDAAQGVLPAAPGSAAVLVIGPGHPAAAGFLAAGNPDRALTVVLPDGTVQRLRVGPARALGAAAAVSRRASTTSALLVEMWSADGGAYVAETEPVAP
ncbi:hypothetical protein ACFFTK_30065 [Pseudonocardia petroleophila]|uniref:hypothetical protein n=1 Tax=Pseudonocardia petroleophila TaxID=37331 RepID=UPI0031CF263B